MSIPLKPIHSDEQLIGSKLKQFERMDTETLLESLRPGCPGSLKTRADGTLLDGHHRVKVLRDRGIDVNSLPRDVISKP
ncbi:MAG: hypothetical protein AMXMBFR4_08920 [Candidatus Hydrogenedentota bacterium]